MRGSCSTNPAAWQRASAEITSLGIDSDSQQQLAARAAAFLAPASPRDGSGTAVSAPDGTTLQFCDSAGQEPWTSQYDPVARGRLGRDWLDANRSRRPHPAVRLLRRSRIVLSGCPRSGSRKRHGVRGPVRARPWASAQRPVGTRPDSAAADAATPRRMGPRGAGTPARRLRDR